MLILTICAYYLLLGLAFGLGFVARGYRVIAPAAAGASLWLRCIWLPAAILLWPLLAVKWWRARRPR